ncbi:hypothetical protein BDB00DRAFT_943162 [Zychaea mexicana]|uniref:uncharacterized protein n=1 Tax=Zychaea mexicana TaxID=64656 RepID=UPI0022FEC956|nr:uncharacterized protein BDB00DRAFT_943162 [Zychaea mexicana]KAI9484348.1 hypothetical protein BDB00DRAFT_943162 [Zychaea mexicana]
MASGTWDSIAGSQSINWRELRAVQHAIDQHAEQWQQQVIEIRSDNMTTCAIINKQGSHRHQHLHQLASKIFHHCHRYKHCTIEEPGVPLSDLLVDIEPLPTTTNNDDDLDEDDDDLDGTLYQQESDITDDDGDEPV